MACQSTIRMIRQAKKTCQRDLVGLASLEYINRRETEQKNNKKPFYANQMKKTMRKYVRHWIRILCYIWRTHQYEFRPQYELTPAQATSLQEWQSVIQQHILSDIDESSDRSDYSDRSDRSDSFSRSRDRTPLTQEAKDQIDTKARHFWISMLDHVVFETEYENGIISGLAILGRDFHRHGWMSPL